MSRSASYDSHPVEYVNIGLIAHMWRPTTVVVDLLQRSFLFQLTNDLCTSLTKIVIILFLNKAVFIKTNFVISIFRAKNRTTVEQPQRYYFNFLSSYAFTTVNNGIMHKVVPVCVRTIV